MTRQLLSRSSASAQLGRFARDGTFDIVLGSAIAGLGAYAYQVWGEGVVLGAVDFAPISALLTIHLLAFAAVLLPVEQIVVRRMSFHDHGGAIPAAALWFVVGTAVLAGGFVLLTADELFGGERWFAAAAAATVLTHAIFVIGRGYLAGDRHYRAYGMASAAASLARLVLTAFVVGFGATAMGLSWALVMGPLVILLWRPVHNSSRTGSPVVRGDSGRLLAGMVVGASASQVLLLAGTLVAGILSDSAAVQSVVFATFTLFRAPLVFGYNLLSRVLRPFTTMAAEGHGRDLHRWAQTLAGLGIVLAAIAGVLGALLGPLVVEIAFGADFRPSAMFAGLVAAGVVAAATGMFLGQVLVARGETMRLALAWVVAVLAGALALLLPIDDVEVLVGVAFLVGEAMAVAVLATWALRPSAAPVPAD